MKKEKKIEQSGGSICGGVISNSMSIKRMKRYGVWADAMSYILPDDKYEKYIAYKKSGKKEQAAKILERYAYSSFL